MSKNNDTIWVIEMVDIYLKPRQWLLTDTVPYECRELARMKAKWLRKHGHVWLRFRVSKYTRSKR